MIKIYPVTQIPPVQDGDEFEWTDTVYCRNGDVLLKGSKAKVIEKTVRTPYGEIMNRGYNLLILTGGKVTVWATFEQCLSRGLLRKISKE